MKSTGRKSISLTFSHLWTIANFSHLCDDDCQWKGEVQSKVFSVPDNENLKFSLIILAKRKGKDGEGYLAVGLSTEEIPEMWEEKVTVKKKWCIVNKKIKQLWCKEYEEREVFSNRMTFDDEYLPVEKLLDFSTGYLKRGKLRVLCEMTLHSPEAIFTLPQMVHTSSYTTIPSKAENTGGTHNTFLFNKLSLFIFGDNASNTNINHKSKIIRSPTTQTVSPTYTEVSKNGSNERQQMSKSQVNVPQANIVKIILKKLTKMFKMFAIVFVPLFVIHIVWYLNFFNDQSPHLTSLTFTHHWTVDNFAHLYDENCQWKWSVESDRFSVPENEEWKFSLSIEPKVKGKNGEEYLKVTLDAPEIPAIWDGKVTVKNTFCIVDEKRKTLICKEYPESEVFKGRGTSGAEYLKVKELLNSPEGYLTGGTLRVLCGVILRSPEAIFNSPEKNYSFSHTTIPSSVSTLSHWLTLSHFKWLTMDSTREMPLGVQSKYFAPERGDIGKLKLQFYPKGWEGKDEENMKIGIRNDNTDSLHVHYELSLIDAKGDKYHQEEDAYRIFPQLGRYHSFPRRRLLSLLDSLPTDEFTFHCHVIVLLEGEQEIAPSCTTTTHFDFALFTFHYVPFTWTIEQLNRQLHKHTIESRIFSPSSDSRYTFNLRIYPKKDSENVILALYFIWTNSIEESTVDWKYSVVDTKGNDWYVKGSTGFSIPKRVESSPQEVIPYRTLDNFASILLPEGTLTIKCELWIHEPRKKLPPELLN